MDFEENYEIDSTANFIHSRNFTIVSLQFPDELLKDSIRVVSALRNKLQSLKDSVADQNGESKEVRLFVMADSTYGSCCVDEIGASHDADCVIHYGHTCFSPTWNKCCQSTWQEVLYGLEYAHAIPHIREEIAAASSKQSGPQHSEFHFADFMCPVTNPCDSQKSSDELPRPLRNYSASDDIGASSGSTHKIGGLIWELPNRLMMEDCLIVWIGSSNAAFANVVLTFNGCEIVRYDAKGNQLVTDLYQQRRILKLRYYLVEKEKDASIVGILVGTLGVAGYLDMIHQMKDLITSARKKAYTLVMGRPNPAKLANFPKQRILSPIITPYEAMVAFNRGSQWTGAYVMEFQDLINSSPVEARSKFEEARFSFMQGRYVEDYDLQDGIEEDNGALSLANATEKALQLHNRNSTSLKQGNNKIWS